MHDLSQLQADCGNIFEPLALSALCYLVIAFGVWSVMVIGREFGFPAVIFGVALVIVGYPGVMVSGILFSCNLMEPPSPDGTFDRGRPVALAQGAGDFGRGVDVVFSRLSASVMGDVGDSACVDFPIAPAPLQSRAFESSPEPMGAAEPEAAPNLAEALSLYWSRNLCDEQDRVNCPPLSPLCDIVVFADRAGQNRETVFANLGASDGAFATSRPRNRPKIPLAGARGVRSRGWDI